MRSVALANAVAVEKPTTNYRDVKSIMKDPAMKAKLNNMVDAAVRLKTQIADKQLEIKDLREAARQDLGLNPKLFNLYVAAVFNNDYALRLDGLGQQVDLIQSILALGLVDEDEEE